MAIRTPFAGADEKIGQKIAEYSLAVLQGRPQFHINMVVDVSPSCDCNDYNDVPIVPDVGMFASFDPVALDQACGDAVNAQKPLPGSSLAEDPDCGKRTIGASISPKPTGRRAWPMPRRSAWAAGRMN